jgi:hypothetical protein
MESQAIASQMPVIVVFPPDPPFRDPEAVTNHQLKTKLAFLKDSLTNPMLQGFHEHFNILIGLYKSGRLSPARKETVYIQGGQVYDTEPEPKDGQPIWTEVCLSLYLLRANTNPSIPAYVTIHMLRSWCWVMNGRWTFSVSAYLETQD